MFTPGETSLVHISLSPPSTHLVLLFSLHIRYLHLPCNQLKIPAKMAADDIRMCIKGIAPAMGDHLRIVIYGILLFSGVAWFLITAALKGKNPRNKRVGSPDLEKPAAKRGTFKSAVRAPGVWTPVDFKRPAAAPYPNWDVHKAEPIPYRPFKHGPYHVTMGLRNMNWDEWIELDKQYLEWHDVKAKRIEERGDQCCRTAPEAYDGAIELLEEL